MYAWEMIFAWLFLCDRGTLPAQSNPPIAMEEPGADDPVMEDAAQGYGPCKPWSPFGGNCTTGSKSIQAPERINMIADLNREKWPALEECASLHLPHITGSSKT